MQNEIRIKINSFHYDEQKRYILESKRETKQSIMNLLSASKYGTKQSRCRYEGALRLMIASMALLNKLDDDLELLRSKRRMKLQFSQDMETELKCAMKEQLKQMKAKGQMIDIPEDTSSSERRRRIKRERMQREGAW